MQQARAVVAEEFEAVNQLILSQLHSNVPLVENIGHYIIDAGGKRLRPLLALLSGGACGQLDSQHVKLAAIVEFIHTATLLHDDVVDLSTLRRGRPTANAEFGNAPSVLVGDFIYSRSFQLLVALGNTRVMALFAETTNTIAEGEVYQLTKAGDASTSEDEYYRIIKNKTAVLFAAATSGAAILANQEQPQIDSLYQYGLELGYAFQLADDILDYEGDPQEMGKNIGDDLNEGKPTLPLIYTLRNGAPQQQALVKNAIDNKSADEIEAIIQAVHDCGALDYCRQRAIQHSERACAQLKKLASSRYTEALARLANLAVTRKT